MPFAERQMDVLKCYHFSQLCRDCTRHSLPDTADLLRPPRPQPLAPVQARAVPSNSCQSSGTKHPDVAAVALPPVVADRLRLPGGLGQAPMQIPLHMPRQGSHLQCTSLTQPEPRKCSFLQRLPRGFSRAQGSKPFGVRFDQKEKRSEKPRNKWIQIKTCAKVSQFHTNSQKTPAGMHTQLRRPMAL